MQKYLRLSPFFIGILLCFITGCGPQRPKGFPEVLVPCSISLTDQGNPLKNVRVLLVPEAEYRSIVFFGTTDASGTAKIVSRMGEYSRPGAPPGDFAITLGESIDIEMPIFTPEEASAQSVAQQEAISKEFLAKFEAARKIPERLGLGDVESTPLKVQVGEQKTEVTFDIADYNKVTPAKKKR